MEYYNVYVFPSACICLLVFNDCICIDRICVSICFNVRDVREQFFSEVILENIV